MGSPRIDRSRIDNKNRYVRIETRCLATRDMPGQSQERSGGVSCALEVLGAADQVVAQVPEEKLNRHLEKMAEEECITKIRELRAFLPATELGGGFVSEEGREFLTRHASLHARDPETIFDCGSTQTHRTKRKSTVGALSLQPTRECDSQQDGSPCGK